MSETTSRPAGVDPAPGQPAAIVPEQPRRSMRRMLAMLGSQKSSGAAALDPLFAAMRRHHQKVDSALIERAYRTSEQYHDGQLRKSGDAYITHPLAVATILASLGLNEPTICAALLHDTVEDTGYTLAQLTHDFGEEIATMVDGVTKLDKVVYGESAKAETIRKMVIAMSRDIRVLISSWPTGCTTCAPSARYARTSRFASRATPWRSMPRWPTGWA